MTELLDAPSFWLTVGDPGPFPEPQDEPACDGWCTCHLEKSPPVQEPVSWAIPGVTCPPPGPSALLTDLQAALDALAVHGPVSGSRTATGLLLDLAERARGLALRELAEMDAVGGHARPGRRRRRRPAGCATGST